MNLINSIYKIYYESESSNNSKYSTKRVNAKDIKRS